VASMVHEGQYIEMAGSGFTLTAPASQMVRTLRVWVGGYESKGQLNVSLSDLSAANYVDASYSATVGTYYAYYDITYNSGLDNETLTVQWSMQTDYKPTGLHGLVGDVAVFAAVLTP